MNIGRGLMGGASPNDCVLVGDELAQVQSSIETLQRQAYSRIRTLKDGLKTVIYLHIYMYIINMCLG